MKYRPLMILGTGSDVGKSIMVAALCRIFRQDGIRVAPFKAQNMALNSFITAEGAEMGRAQVMQAQAAGLAPQVDMNPILLKPCAGVGCQVIVHGKVYANLGANDYYRQKAGLVRRVMASFRRLQASHDLVILEGAGSAAELNLRKSDLVNFSMARRAGAAVLLVADIDRGGVFAATIGTFHLLTPSERGRLAGFIINKLRGDASLFSEGVKIIQARTRKPVFGVVPYMRDLKLPQEDSVALDRKLNHSPAPEATRLRLGVLRLPHISNYTDFDPLEQDPGVALQYLDHRRDLKDMDMVILPGTKNTIADLVYLKQSGLFQRLQDYARHGGQLIGICGGFQMLGQAVKDPLGVEGTTPEEEGLGLLPLATTMAGNKTTTRVEARVIGLPGVSSSLRGYEIHMGLTAAVGPGQPVFEIYQRLGESVRVADGWISPDHRVWGSYIHGLFDNDDFRHILLQQLRAHKGLTTEVPSAPAFAASLEAEFDRLADIVRRHLDLDQIKALIRP
ncbi:MAG: cobyric acid synthase [Desulfobacteraceae bacterium]